LLDDASSVANTNRDGRTTPDLDSNQHLGPTDPNTDPHRDDRRIYSDRYAIEDRNCRAGVVANAYSDQYGNGSAVAYSERDENRGIYVDAIASTDRNGRIVAVANINDNRDEC
jgi:hypothetical protein